MARFALACACAFAAALGPAAAQTARPPSHAPAAEATPSPVAEKIALAVSKMISFRVKTASGGATTTTIVNIPLKRMKYIIANGGPVSETVIADGRMYARSAGTEWHATFGPARAAGSLAKMVADASKMRMLVDRAENGTTVGAYEMNPFDGSDATLTLTCTYDKKTYLPRYCANQTFSQTFEGWNDPANVIEVPVVPTPRPVPKPIPSPRP